MYKQCEVHIIMARLWRLDNISGDIELLFKVIEREGVRHVAWDEDLDVVTIDEKELEMLADALGKKIIPKDSVMKDRSEIYYTGLLDDLEKENVVLKNELKDAQYRLECGMGGDI